MDLDPDVCEDVGRADEAADTEGVGLVRGCGVVVARGRRGTVVAVIWAARVGDVVPAN